MFESSDLNFKSLRFYELYYGGLHRLRNNSKDLKLIFDKIAIQTS